MLEPGTLFFGGVFWKNLYFLIFASLLIWTKGAKMHTHFPDFQNFFIYPSLVWTERAVLYPFFPIYLQKVHIHTTTNEKYPFTHLHNRYQNGHPKLNGFKKFLSLVWTVRGKSQGIFLKLFNFLRKIKKDSRKNISEI